MSRMPHPGDFQGIPVREPPRNVEAEQALIGAVLMNNEAWHTIGAKLAPEDFSEEVHAHIWDLCGRMIPVGRVASPITLRSFLGDHDIGGITVHAYLARLAADATTIINARDYAGLVSGLAVRRRIIAAAEEAAAVAYDAPVDHPPLRILEDTIGTLRGIADQTGEGVDAEGLDRTFGELIEAAQDRLAGKVAAAPSSGFVDVDRTLSGGLLPGRLIVLAGRPGMGKTVLMAAMARRTAASGSGAGVFSLEIDRKELTSRVVANALASDERPIDYSNINQGALNEQQIERLCHAREQMRALPLQICEQGGLSMAQIETRALGMKRRLERQGHRLEVVFIDYLQLVQVSNRYKGDPVAELGEVTLAAKNLAKRIGICVVLLSQLNRGVETRDNKRPLMSDLRGSGNIEEHADAVGLLYRPEYYDKDDPKVLNGDAQTRLEAFQRRHLLEVHWAKNRLGPTDTTHLFCDVARSQIDNHSHTREG